MGNTIKAKITDDTLELDDLAPLQVLERYARMGRLKIIPVIEPDPVPGVAYRVSPTTGKKRPIKPKPNRTPYTVYQKRVVLQDGTVLFGHEKEIK